VNVRFFCVLADQVEFVAFIALEYLVVLGKRLPVSLLIGCQYANAAAQRTGVVQCVQDCGSDELTAVGQPRQRVGKRLVYLERDNFAFTLCTHAVLPPAAVAPGSRSAARSALNNVLELHTLLAQVRQKANLADAPQGAG